MHARHVQGVGLLVCCWVLAVAAALAEPLQPGLREAFQTLRCLPADRPPAFPFAGSRIWLLEANPWASQRLATAIAAILLREVVGYDVDINEVTSTTEVYHRASKVAVADAGPALAERLAAGDFSRFGYANLEVWPEGKREAFAEFVAQGRRAVEVGLVGYEGREGWYVPATFAQNPAFASAPEFYRAYDVSRNASAGVLAALRRHATVACDEAECCCVALASCAVASSARGGADSAEVDGQKTGELRWCPEHGGEERLPAVLSPRTFRQEGLQEELARSNGFRFAMRFLDPEAFARLATEALSNGAAQVVHTWRPSLLLARLRHHSAPATRVVLPTDECGWHAADGTGDWSCDMPRQALQKVASLEVLTDPVAREFLSGFLLPEARPPGSRPPAARDDLAGAGVRELLEGLVASARGEARPASDAEVVEVACRWVLANEATWEAWAKPRNIPFFADSLSASYPLPAVIVLLLLAVGYASCLEGPWLHTTLSLRSVSAILEKNKHRTWRTSLERRLRRMDTGGCCEPEATPLGAAAVSVEPGLCKEPATGVRRRTYTEDRVGAPDSTPGLEEQRYWEGLGDRAEATAGLRAFWRRAEERLAAAPSGRWPCAGGGGVAPTAGAEAPAPPEDCVSFAHHVFPCMQASGEAVVLLCRSLKGAFSKGQLSVEGSVEVGDGGAKAGRDFEAGVWQVSFPAGSEFAVLRIQVAQRKDVWQNSCSFQVRLKRVTEGTGVVAYPACAAVLVLSENRWPANIPDELRSGMGINLMRYYIYSDRIRRGDKWKKTMLAMVWLPVHSVLVSTLVQKILVDHAAQAVLTGAWGGGADPTWPYVECALLVLTQLLSLGLNRWADVVQTRNRGRTGGIRSFYRGELLRKFVQLEHSEHWEASEASWMYSAIYDVDVITTRAYFQVFILAQSCFALLLSVLLIIALALYKGGSSQSVHPVMLLYPLGVFLMIPIGILGVWIRRILLWVVVIARKSGERDWFRSYTWLMMHWRQFHGLLFTELVAMEKHVQEMNDAFVPSHWDARDTMNDTAWVTHWVQGIAYCFMLLLGSFALIEYQTYGIGAMEVGTFYAFCKIYLSVGKYVGRLSGVFVAMQQAVVSLREIAALLNQAGQGSRRREALLWARLGAAGGGRPPGQGLRAVVFEEGLNFVRPGFCKVGSTFGELRLAKRCELPLGWLVGVRASNERVLRSFLGLAAQVLQPTGPQGEDLTEGAPRVLLPPELRALSVPVVPVHLTVTGSSIVEQLLFTGASHELCVALARCVGLEPDRETTSLGPGSGQVFSLVRALLADPDVLCTFRPLSLVPADVRHRVLVLLRVWQACGGLPGIADLLGVALVEAQEPEEQKQGSSAVYRSPMRTLVVGNADVILWEGLSPEVDVDLDAFLWRGGPLVGENNAGSGEEAARQHADGYTDPVVPSQSLLHRGNTSGPITARCTAGCLGLW